MKFVNYQGRAGILVEDGVVDVETLTHGAFGPEVRPCLDHWEEFSAAVAEADTSTAEALPYEPAKVGPPVPEPRQLFAIGLNYRDHAEETGIPIPEIPIVFAKFPSSLTGPQATVELPSDNVDFEAELVAVIGSEAHKVTEDEAWDHVAGLTVGQDISERIVQTRGDTAQWSLGKSYPGFSPCGPALVTRDELATPDAMDIHCRIGDDVLQHSNTRQLIFTVPFIVSYLSSIVTLYPGDLIYMGTPDGVGFTRDPQRMLQPGETLVTEIEGLGRLDTTFTSA